MHWGNQETRQEIMRARSTSKHNTKNLNMEAKNCHERILSRIFHVSLTTGIVLILILKDTGNLDYLFLSGRFDPQFLRYVTFEFPSLFSFQNYGELVSVVIGCMSLASSRFVLSALFFTSLQVAWILGLQK